MIAAAKLWGTSETSVGQTIAFCGLFGWAGGPRNHEKLGKRSLELVHQPPATTHQPRESFSTLPGFDHYFGGPQGHDDRLVARGGLAGRLDRPGGLSYCAKTVI